MPAYLKSTVTTCICAKALAEWVVIDKMGHQRPGVWCQRCGDQIVRELDAADKPSSAVKPVPPKPKGRKA